MNILKKLPVPFFLLPILCGALTLIRVDVRGAEFRGANALLDQALAASSQPKATQKLTPTDQLRADLKALAANAAGLEPTKAAEQWLALLERCQTLEASPTSLRSGRPLRLEEVFDVLPPPSSWPALAKAIESRPSGEGSDAVPMLGLCVVAHTLTGEAAKRQQDLATLEKLAAKAKPSQAYAFNSIFEMVRQAVLQSLSDPDLTLQVLYQQISVNHDERDYGQGIDLPDLVALAGAQKAEAFLRKALTNSSQLLKVEPATATAKLAQKLALELCDHLKKPQWSLVNSLNAVDLYEAMDKRFGKKPSSQTESAPTIPGIPSMAMPIDQPGDYEKKTAQVYYFLGLIAEGRTTNAVAVARQFQEEAYFPDEVIRDMERAGFAKELNAFFHDLLQEDPERPFWEEYVQLAAHAGATEEMVKLVRTSATKSGLSKGQRIKLQQLLYTALLANDDIDAGVAELRLLIASPPELTSRNRWAAKSRGHLALQLANIGRLLGRTNLLEEGLAAARKDLQNKEEDMEGYSESVSIALAKLLQKLGRGTEAEQVLADKLLETTQLELKSGRARAAEMRGHSPSAGVLQALVALYHHAGRYDDVMKLFDRAPWWGAADLASLQRSYRSLEDYNYNTGTHLVAAPLGFYAANALAKTGHTEEARRLLDQLLGQDPACDPLYELLLLLDDQNAPSKLDSLFARDQFEERPLIWKAHWLRTHQRLEEAEQVARKAISIDPTDGEEPPGDRLRAYAELAEIRAVRGDQKEAETLRGAVAAVQQAENADQYMGCGLLKRAVSMYEDSLTRFADAYCIHARLAVQLSDLGRHQEAEEHYRRAYELMPDSFGRVESHCFGCERAFAGERAQSIAEKVFTRLAKATPNKPQVHYLLGYLQEEEQRFGEALVSYRMAVKLDPDYLNAWVKIEGLSPRVAMPATERDTVIFNVLRLDPFQRRGSVSFGLVSDLGALWNNVATAVSKRPVKAASLYPLAASKALIDKNKAEPALDDFERRYSMPDEEEMPTTPAKAVAQNLYIRAAQQLLGRNFDMGD